MKKNYLLEPLRGQRTLVRKYFYFTNFSKEKYINAPGTTLKNHYTTVGSTSLWYSNRRIKRNLFH